MSVLFRRWGPLIRELREKKGLTQDELATRASTLGKPPLMVKRAYIARLEMGYIDKPSPDVLRALAFGLGVPLTELERMRISEDRQMDYRR
jgi:transcriptional regulator with XRE-family HTH domain